MNDYSGSERREHPTVCLHENEWGQIHQYIKNQDERWQRIEGKVCRHIDEGERSGGVRDRVLVLEREIGVLKQGYWKVGLSTGFLGALLGQITPEVLTTLVKWITHTG